MEEAKRPAPFAVLEDEKQALELAKSLNPTLEERVWNLQKSVDSLRMIASEGLIEALRDAPTEQAERGEVCWCTPFGWAVRRDGRWVGVVASNDNIEYL